MEEDPREKRAAKLRPFITLDKLGHKLEIRPVPTLHYLRPVLMPGWVNLEIDGPRGGLKVVVGLELKDLKRLRRYISEWIAWMEDREPLQAVNGE